jgi:flagellar biogenesis protein FliO
MAQHNGFPWKKLIFGAGFIAALVWIVRRLLGDNEQAK